MLKQPLDRPFWPSVDMSKVDMEFDDLADIAERYDAFLIDQFGVLIDGQNVYPGAVAALTHFSKLGKPVVILSNSGKRAQANCDRVVSFGFQRAHFQTVVTSGEIAHQSIKASLGNEIHADAMVMVLARQGDVSPIADLGLAQTDDPQIADLLLIVSRDLGMSREDYASILRIFHASGGQCYCLNPDLKMLTPDGLQFSAGTIANLYEQMGGRVEWFGKPHPQIYESAQTHLPNVPAHRILCIGDSIHHDIVGGSNAGLATALVRCGVHEHVSDEGIVELLSDQGVSPDHFLKSFALSR